MDAIWDDKFPIPDHKATPTFYDFGHAKMTIEVMERRKLRASQLYVCTCFVIFQARTCSIIRVFLRRKYQDVAMTLVEKSKKNTSG